MKQKNYCRFFGKELSKRELVKKQKEIIHKVCESIKIHSVYSPVDACYMVSLDVFEMIEKGEIKC